MLEMKERDVAELFSSSQAHAWEYIIEAPPLVKGGRATPISFLGRT
ncbi:MAG: hypothetical protein RLZZ532_2736 [Cyanobacteriota bacterium]|jgi:hypothetical protein